MPLPYRLETERPTTTFNGQADSVTLVADRVVNHMTRIVASKFYRSNQRAGGLPLMCRVMISGVELGAGMDDGT